MPVTHELPSVLPESRLAQVTEVAKYLAISRSKVYQLMDAGKLPYVKLGKSRRVRWSDVSKLVEKHVIGEEV